MRNAVVLAVAISSVALLVGCGGGAAQGTGASGGASTAAPAVCATFYMDVDLQGVSLVAKGPSDDEPTIPPQFNDNMSSVAVTPGCTVMAYADGNYSGQAVTFTETTKAIVPTFNDQMSSFKCACHGGG
jgi:hypothetical protein